MEARLDYEKVLGFKVPDENNPIFPCELCINGKEAVSNFLKSHGVDFETPEYILQDANYIAIKNNEVVFGDKELLVIYE